MKKLLLIAIICIPFISVAQVIPVPNGDFETPSSLSTGAVQNWSGTWFESNSDMQVESANQITGLYSVRFTGVGAANVRLLKSANPAAFSVTDGHTYKVKFNWRIQTASGPSGGANTDGNTFTASALECNSTGGIEGATLAPTATTTSPSNVPGTFNFKVTNAVNFPKIKLVFSKDGGIAYLDDVTLEDLGVLPITLTSFTGTATNNGVSLNWTTASESNNKSFTVFSSKDGQDFTQIGTVNGAGNSTSVNNYSFADKNPANGANYYKLVQTDFDGKTESFTPISVKFNLASATALSVYATQTKIQGQLNWVKNEQATVTVTDLAGKTVLSQKVNLQNGVNAIALSGAALASSNLYVLTVSGSSATTSVKFYTN